MHYNPIKVILRPIFEPFSDKAYAVCKGEDNTVWSLYAWALPATDIYLYT